MLKIKDIVKIRKFIYGGLTAIMLVAVAVTIYSCNKDRELDTTRGKLMGSTGTWDCTVTHSIGTIVVPAGTGTEMPCTRYFVNRFWNADMQRYSGFSHTTEVHKCGTGTAAEVLTSIEFTAELLPAILHGPNLGIDYTNVNNFILRVDDQDVVPGFAYVKPYVYEVLIEDEDDGVVGDVITKTGLIHITYESVLSVWSEINAQMEWGGANNNQTEWQEYYENHLIRVQSLSNSTGVDIIAVSQMVSARNLFNQFEYVITNGTEDDFRVFSMPFTELCNQVGSLYSSFNTLSNEMKGVVIAEAWHHLRIQEKWEDGEDPLVCGPLENERDRKLRNLWISFAFSLTNPFATAWWAYTYCEARSDIWDEYHRNGGTESRPRSSFCDTTH